MHDKQFKVIYFSLWGSESKEVVLTWKRIASILFSTFVVLVLLAGALLALFTNYFHNARIEALEKTKKTLIAQLNEVNSHVVRLSERMQTLEKENDDLGIFLDVPVLNNDVREVGIGGMVDKKEIELAGLVPEELGRHISDMRGALSQVERRMFLFKDQRNNLLQTLETKEDKYRRTPSIRPVIGGRISDKFGLRVDPFTELRRHHDGIDIVAEIGSDVVSSAAGVVVVAKRTYSIGRGYGKEVVVDHGDGVRTRYAHLSKVLVKEGQRIKRHEVIGQVGDTGRSTGPHLHYEVLVDDKPVNPFNFILN